MQIKDEYTVNEVATILQTNPETVRKWIKEGRLKAIQGNSKKEGMRIDEPSIESFLSDNPKYTKSASIAIAAAIITGGVTLPASLLIRAQKRAQVKDSKGKNTISNIRIKSSDMIKLLEEEISQEESLIHQHTEQIIVLQNEIEERKQKIENINQMISELKEEEAKTDEETLPCSDLT